MQTQKGITLISLVITIILLLILAGVTINFAIGENGIFKLAEDATEKYKNSAEKEEAEIAKANEYIANGRETVVISKEEYESLIPSPIGEDSLLMSSNNGSLAVQNINLTSFTNDFSDSFENYFSYDSTTGELTCKKAGWYIVKLEIDIDSANGTSTTSTVSLFINNINMGDVKAVGRVDSVLQYDCNTITFYVKPGEKLKFSKNTIGVVARLYECRYNIIIQNVIVCI